MAGKNLPGWVIICGDAQCDRFIFAGWPLNSAFFIRRLTPLELGFETYYIEDATRALSEEGFNQAKELVAGRGGKLVTSDRLG